MEKELERKIFMLKDYSSKDAMENEINIYIKVLKNKYPKAIITKEFYKGENILVRVTEVENKKTTNKQNDKEKTIDDWYIRQRGER